LLAQLGALAVAFFPYRVEPVVLDIHIIAAFLAFFPVAFMGLAYGGAYFLEHKMGGFLLLVLAGFVVLLALFGVVFPEVATTWDAIAIDSIWELTYPKWIALMSSTEPHIGPIRFLEWVAMPYMVLWAAAMGWNLQKYAEK
jgi:hypothetical protein